MAIKLGLDAKLYRNTGTFAAPVWNEVKNVKDVTLNLEAGEADVTTRGNAGWRATVATLKDGSIEFEMVWDTADDDFGSIRDTFLNRAAMEFAVMDGDITVAGSQGLRATCMVTNFSRNEALEEAITVSVTVKPTYHGQRPDRYEPADRCDRRGPVRAGVRGRAVRRLSVMRAGRGVSQVQR